MIFTSNHFVPSEIIQVPGVVGDSKMVKSRTLQEGTVEGDQPQWGGLCCNSPLRELGVSSDASATGKIWRGMAAGG